MRSACVEILLHMDTMMVLSALVRDMVAAERELGALRTGVLVLRPQGPLIYTIPSWLEEFLLKDQLLSLWVFPCVLFVVFPLLLLIFVLCV